MPQCSLNAVQEIHMCKHLITVQSRQHFRSQFVFSCYYACRYTAMHIVTVANLDRHPTNRVIVTAAQASRNAVFAPP